jgi:hypothetical protein
MHTVSCLLTAVSLLAPFATRATDAPTAGEARAERAFRGTRGDPGTTLAFLRPMPKGGDLHNHLSGSVYAESFIRWAADAGLCVSPSKIELSSPPCDGADIVPVTEAQKTPALYRRIVDAFSMRNWQLSGQSGHDHFFGTFSKFSRATEGQTGKMLAETASRAAAQGEIYQELMLTPASELVTDLAKRTAWDDDFGRLRQAMLDGMKQVVEMARTEIEKAEAIRDEELGCRSSRADPGCEVVQRYVAQVSRGSAREKVFAQMLAGFEVASSVPQFVALNLVQPEDDPVPMRDFSLQMRMLQYLHNVYPKVHITLHAGELAPGLVPPEGLAFHVRDSILMGQAERIGHGVDVMGERDALGLLREMARRRILVEICLTSNEGILGVRGAAHPLGNYLRAGVPVALATDDEGVSRSDMTHEYLKAAQEQGLGYRQLKRMARNSLTYAFLPGESLWRADGSPARACASELTRAGARSRGCQQLLDGSEKARLQRRLEEQFAQFESNLQRPPR